MNTKTNETPTKRNSSAILWITLPVVVLVAVAAATVGTSRLRSAPPVVARSALLIETVQRGPLVRRVAGTGELVPEDTRWLAAATEARVDRIYLRPGDRVLPDTVIMQLSNPDLERQCTDADLATKKAEAELANLRVQLQAQLLDEHATEAELESDGTEARLEAQRDEALAKQGIGAEINAKISRARANSIATRLQIEHEKLAIAEEARQAQLAAKQAEVAQVQALYELKTQQKEALLVRAGISGVLEEVSVGSGQQVNAGTNLARVSSSERLVARIRIPESEADDVRLRQKAEVAVENKTIPGHVTHIDPAVQNGSVNVDLRVDGAQPAGARSDLSVGGSIEVERVPNAVYLPKELRVRSDSTVSLFRISGDGTEAQRVVVKLGRVSVDGVEIENGLKPGDRVIVSDMSTWKRYDHLRLE
ncbi:MAG TPA: HlyD family efflux transporter periplasmic adaptor subunit [Terriglobales bacterium]|nr:HlyD family efflux transporter periplasmic adaptor subunit [Terriglobales bacterium]